MEKIKARQIFAEQVIEFLKQKKEFDDVELQRILSYAYQKVRKTNNQAKMQKND